MDTPLVNTAMHWMTEMAETVPEMDRNKKKPLNDFNPQSEWPQKEWSAILKAVQRWGRER